MRSRDVPSGLSIYGRQVIQIEHSAVSNRTELGPFSLGFKRLPRLPEHRADRSDLPPPHARLTIESHEIREGGQVCGRGVVYVPEETSFRRIDLRLYQGIRHRQLVVRVALVGGKEKGLLGGPPLLEPGSHPFYLELAAPAVTPWVDPFQLELALVRGLFAEVRSTLLPLYLLPRREEAPPAPPPPPAIRIVPRQPPPPAEPDPKPVALEPPPAALAIPPPEGWCPVQVSTAGHLYDSGESTGRMVKARFYRAPAEQPDRLTLEAPSIPITPEFTVRIHGGSRLNSLNLAIHYELVRPGGAEVSLPGFPVTEETRLLGERALDPSGYGDGSGVQVLIRVPTERLAALAQARKAVAHNAALRLHLALDAIDRKGRVVPSSTRSVTFTTP
jgi:hypothetical protein